MMMKNASFSAESVFAAYTTFAAAAMVARTAFSELRRIAATFIPKPLEKKILAFLTRSLRRVGLIAAFIGSGGGEDMITLTVDKNLHGFSANDLFGAAETYLASKIARSDYDADDPRHRHLRRLHASKARRDGHVTLTMSRKGNIADYFDGTEVLWRVSVTGSSRNRKGQKQYDDDDFDDDFDDNDDVQALPLPAKMPKMSGYNSISLTPTMSSFSSISLTFHKSFKDKVVELYLPYVIECAEAIKAERKVVKLYSRNGSSWSSVDFHHPSSFETLAMDDEVKKALIRDLDKFVRRREFYKRVGKAWKRAYLLYGPPGTGKSSLVAAMANHLKFDVYDLQLSGLPMGNKGLRDLMVSTGNKSIIVIEDIDCSLNNVIDDRRIGYNGKRKKKADKENKLTLSGLLNFADGLWSSCGDEKIIVFTTNYKERLDPALLRPGRMDMHIHMSYLTPSGFRTLAFNYLFVKDHYLFREIKEMIKEVEVTPAEVAEELLKNDDAGVALQTLIKFLQGKKKTTMMLINTTGDKDDKEEKEEKDDKDEDDDDDDDDDDDEYYQY